MQRISALKLGFQVSFRLENEVLPVSRVKKNLPIFCSKGMGYSSSGPLRYIPKKSRNANEKLNSPPFEESYGKDEYPSSLDPNATCSSVEDEMRTLGTSVFLDVKKRFNTGRRENSFLDASGKEFNEKGYELGDQEAEIEVKEVSNELKLHMEDDAVKRRPGRSDDVAQNAENIAIEILAKRAVTVAELRKKLISKRLPPDIVESLIHEFKSRGLINDVLYAESFSRSRWSSSSWGPRRIKQALYRKGVNASDIDRALKLVFEGREDNESEESRVGMSEANLDRLYVQASKQWARSSDKQKEARKARMIRWLQYRGFSWGIISLVLNKLEG